MGQHDAQVAQGHTARGSPVLRADLEDQADPATAGERAFESRLQDVLVVLRVDLADRLEGKYTGGCAVDDLDPGVPPCPGGAVAPQLGPGQPTSSDPERSAAGAGKNELERRLRILESDPQGRPWREAIDWIQASQ